MSGAYLLKLSCDQTTKNQPYRQALMNQTHTALSNIWHHFQTTPLFFPGLQEEVGKLTTKQKQFIEVLELVQIETHLPYIGRLTGRPGVVNLAIWKSNVTLEVRQTSPLPQFTRTNPLTLFNSSKPIFLNVR
jgi:hypothetical protein